MSEISYETYAGDRVTGDGEHVVMLVGGVRVAGAVRLRQRYSTSDPNAMKWYVTPCIPGAGVRATEVRDEQHALEWLEFLAGLCGSAVGCEGVCADVEPPADAIFEADIADGEEISAAELDDDEDDYWREVESCCGGRSYWCDHYRHYPPVAAAERW